MDEWEVDVYAFDDANHRVVFNYGKRNPILHLLSIIDERTTFIMDWLLTIRIDADTLTLAERAMRGFWTPLRLVADRASRFRDLARGHVVTRPTGELVELLDGPLGLLGVKPRGSEEKNPRANRIERMHGLYADRARRDFGFSWRPPKKVRGFAGRDLREATGIDDRVHRHYAEHCRRGEATELLPISQIAAQVAAWIDEINNAETEAKGCHGLTRAAAFKYFSPQAAEIAARRLSEAAIDEAFAERLTRTVRDGGIIELADGARYDAAELALFIGQEVGVRRFRRDRAQIYVDAPDGVIVARRRPLVGLYDEDLLAQESAELARRRRLLGDTSQAAAAKPEAPLPSPAEDSHLSISSTEWMMRRQGRSRADALGAPAELRPPRAEPEIDPAQFVAAAEDESETSAPSLYDLSECTAEEL
jgi:hypothetical protein